MANLTFRASLTPTLPEATTLKSTPLTNLELDANFKALNDELSLKANSASPALTGIPTAPTAESGTNTTQIATTAFVKTAIDAVGTVSAPLESPTLSGTPTAPTATLGTNTTQIATTAFVVSQIADSAPSKTGTGASGTWGISISGNAATVTNGVVTTGSYADPSWITSLSKSKVGLSNVENVALSTWAGSANITTIGAATASSLIVTGNLTVNGTTTTINSTTISVDDKNIELGSVSSPTNTTADGGGITLKGATDKTFNWVNATSAWTSSEDINLLTGKVYKINGTTVLSANALGSGVTGSSLTSVGTISSGTWQGTDVGLAHGGTNATLTAVNGGIVYSTASAMAITPAGTAGQVLTSNGANAPSWSNITPGVTAEDDTLTDATYYPAIFTTTSGLQTNAKVSSTKLYFNPSTGTLNATVFNSLSDANQKTNVISINNATETVSKISGVEFDWKDNGKHSAGVVAQELEKILPFLVETNEDGVKSVNYSGIVAYLIQAVKELDSRLNKYEDRT